MKARAPRVPLDLDIEGLSHEGRGVARHAGKTVFVDGALPGERVTARILRTRGRFDEAVAIAVLRASPARVAPRCAHFGTCGGCSLQHLDEAGQLAHKQGVLLELLSHQAGVEPETVAPPIRGPQWGYRRKARVGVKFVAKKGGVLIGFRERASPYVTDCQRCDILDPRIGTRLADLRGLLAALSIPAHIPQLEIALSDRHAVIVLRHLAPLSDADRALLSAFAVAHDLDFYLQPGGPDTVHPLHPPPVALRYTVDALDLAFEPLDFTQVNAPINARMVERALEWLAPGPRDHVADLFCGLGNFTLPLARRAGRVSGFEGVASLIGRARENARANGLDNCEFSVADLAAPATVRTVIAPTVDKLLLDPPRAGASIVVEEADLARVERLVYVSCNPVTFARDAARLTARHGFRLRATGILDMFPHTAHVESISLFEHG